MLLPLWRRLVSPDVIGGSVSGWVLESYLEDGVLKGPPIKYTRPRLTNDLKCLTAKSTSWDLKIW